MSSRRKFLSIMSENIIQTFRTSLQALATGLLLHPWADAVAQFSAHGSGWSSGETFAFFVMPWIGLCAVAGVLIASGAYWRKASLHALWRAALLFLGAETMAFLMALLSTKMSTAAILAYVFLMMGLMFPGIIFSVLFLLFLLFPYVLSKRRATRCRKKATSLADKKEA